jgi:hypothetical protein
LQFFKLYKGTAKRFPKAKSESIGRLFRPDTTTSFREQLATWFDHVKVLRGENKLKKEKLELRRNRAGGLLAQELHGLGVTFDENGKVVWPDL